MKGEYKKEETDDNTITIAKKCKEEKVSKPSKSATPKSNNESKMKHVSTKRKREEITNGPYPAVEPHMSKETGQMVEGPVNASGLVYFKLSNDHVMALNYNAEDAFPRFSLRIPTFEYKDYQYNQLKEYNGKLGFTGLSPKEVDL
ncbi:hypothetical protein BC332_00964 [Capsicum chinense]|nr:hypothetical protein BC332_00964 [Capsicum chinense]